MKADTCKTCGGNMVEDRRGGYLGGMMCVSARCPAGQPGVTTPTPEQRQAAEELSRGLEAHFVLIEGYRQFAKDNHSNKPERERYHKLAEEAFADLEAWVAQREAKAYKNGHIDHQLILEASTKAIADRIIQRANITAGETLVIDAKTIKQEIAYLAAESVVKAVEERQQEYIEDMRNRKMHLQAADTLEVRMLTLKAARLAAEKFKTL